MTHSRVGRNAGPHLLHLPWPFLTSGSKQQRRRAWFHLLISCPTVLRALCSSSRLKHAEEEQENDPIEPAVHPCKEPTKTTDLSKKKRKMDMDGRADFVAQLS